ncbi:hypothetical protein [Thalassotalea marina]|uniref:Solute-binding protein family 3/N-terminal domain-containing protein n=1 Tax=Thalassotalea marina TaxID=1673741 RepID=A0A919BKC9_9GAMM|nr:hypothetical protein [Thalassotalea marina]GHF94581.1 hypothetical protein GCM10017161_23540 [Thalassotalea marina]
MRVLFCLLLLAYSVNLFAFERDYIVRLGSEVEWAPYHVSTAKGADGMSVRAVACIMARINQPYTIDKLPWKRAQVMTKVGQLDGFFSASKSDDRDIFAVQSKVFLPQKRSFFLLKSRLTKPLETYTPEYIKQHLLTAGRQGSNALHSLENHGYNIAVKTRDTASLIEVLKHHRADAILDNELVLLNDIKGTTFKPSDFLIVALEEHPMGVYFAKEFLQKRPQFLADFNREVDACTLISSSDA